LIYNFGCSTVICAVYTVGCESLSKLDFTVNFIGELTSIESLCSLLHLKEMYVMHQSLVVFSHDTVIFLAFYVQDIANIKRGCVIFFDIKLFI